MKNIYCLLLLLWTGQQLKAQQMPLLSEYMHSPALINPAMIGWEDLTALTAAYRHQWTGLENNPITFALNFRHFDEERNMAFGGGLTHDQTGPTSFTGLNVQYAYHLKFNSERKRNEKRHRLALGLSLSANQYRLDGSKLKYNDVDDPLIVTSQATTILPDAGVGAFYYNDLYYIGISVPQLISMNVRFDSDNALSNMRRVAHFYFNAGAKIKLQAAEKAVLKSNIYERAEHLLLPSMWFRYAPNSPLNVHVHVRYLWRQQLGFGASISTDGTLGFDATLQLKKRFRVGYAFSVPIGDISPYVGSNHELMLTYIFGSKGNGWLFEVAPQQIQFKKNKAANQPTE